MKKRKDKWPLYIEVINTKHKGLRGYAYSETEKCYKVTLFKDGGTMFKTELSKHHVRKIQSWKEKRNEKIKKMDSAANNKRSTANRGAGKPDTKARAAQSRKAAPAGETGHLKSNY